MLRDGLDDGTHVGWMLNDHSSERTSPASPSRGDGRLWAIILAGGEGVRLRPLVRLVCGDDRPKQYVPLLGSRSLLQETLDRVALRIPSERTVIVTMQSHAPYMSELVSHREAAHVLAQPRDRGTAAAILLPAHWIAWRDPEATVAVFPSDHFVLGESTFMEHVAGIAEWIDRHPARICLVGAQPGGPETEYGWIEPGEVLDGEKTGLIRQVRRFWEKPSEAMARACLNLGALWNTFVIVAKVATLVNAGYECLPTMSERLGHMEPFDGTAEEAWAVQQAYSLMPTVNFSRSILAPCPPYLAVSMLPRIIWSDLGTPRRVLGVLRRLRVRPPWLRSQAAQARLSSLEHITPDDPATLGV